jgi:hypothetical protein
MWILEESNPLFQLLSLLNFQMEIFESEESLKYHLSVFSVAKTEEKIYQEIRRLCEPLASLEVENEEKNRIFRLFLSLQEDQKELYKLFTAAYCDAVTAMDPLTDIFQDIVQRFGDLVEDNEDAFDQAKTFLKTAIQKLQQLLKEEVLYQMVQVYHHQSFTPSDVVTFFFNQLRTKAIFPDLVQLFVEKDCELGENDDIIRLSLLLIEEPSLLKQMMYYIPEFLLTIYANIPEIMTGDYGADDIFDQYIDRDLSALSERVVHMKEIGIYEPEAEELQELEPEAEVSVADWLYMDPNAHPEKKEERELENVDRYYESVKAVEKNLFFTLAIWNRVPPVSKKLFRTFTRMAIFTGNEELIEAAFEFDPEIEEQLIFNAIEGIYEHLTLKDRKQQTFQFVKDHCPEILEEDWEEFATRMRNGASNFGLE